MISTPPDSVACLLQSLLLKYQAQVEHNINPVDIPKPASSGPPADREVSPGISHVCSTRNEADRSAATAQQQARAPPVASAQQAAAFQLPRAKRTKPFNAEQLAGQYLAKRLKTIQQNKQKASQTQHKSASSVARGAQSPADAPKRSSWAIGSSLQQPQQLESLREGPLGERQSTAAAAGHQQQQAQNVHPEPGQQAPRSTATVADRAAANECTQGSAHIAAAADGLELIFQQQQQELRTDAGAAADVGDDDLLHLWNKGLQEDSSMHGAATAAAEALDPHPVAAAAAAVAGQAGAAGVVDRTAAAVLEASVAAGDLVDDVVMTGSSPQAAAAAAAATAMPLNWQDTEHNAAAAIASGFESTAAAMSVDADPNSTAARMEALELMHGVEAAAAAQPLGTQPRQSEPAKQQPQQQQGEQQQQHQQQAAQPQHAHQQQLPMDNEESKEESAAAAPAAAPAAGKTSFLCKADSPQPAQAAAAAASGARRFTLASLLFAMPELPIKQAPEAPGKQQQPAARQAKHKPAAAALPAGFGKATDLSADRPAGYYAGKRHTPPQQLQQQPLQPQASASGRAAHKHPQAAAASGSSSDEEGEIAAGDLSPPTAAAAAAAAWDYATPSAGSDGDDHDLMYVDDPAAAAAAAAGLKRKRKKSRGGRQVRQRQQRAEADRAAAAAGGAGGAGGALGLYAEIKQWEKENSKGRKQKLAPVDAARELRFSITEKPPCRFWQMGRCSKGADCPYPHTGQPASKLVGCKFHQRGQCRHGDECRFSHEVVSKQPCPDMVLYHKCSKQAGGGCAYSHEPLEPDVAEALRRMLLKMQDDEQQQQQQQMVQTGAQQVDKQQRPGLAPPAAPQQQQQQSVILGPAPPQQSFDQWQQQQQHQKQQAATGLNQQTTWHQLQLGTHLQGQQAPMPPLQWQQMNLAPQHHAWPPQQQLQPQHPPGIDLQQSRELLPTSLLQQRTLAVPSPAMPPQGVPPQNPVHLHRQQAHQQQHQQMPRPGVHGASGRVMRPG